MLSELPRDPLLPHLARLFDTTFIADRLRTLLAREQVVDCSIERVKYRPRRACVVAYKLGVRTVAGAQAVRRFAICMYGPEDARERYAKARSLQPVGAQHSLPPVALLGDLHALAWPFPHDRKLPALPQLADDARIVTEHLPGLVRARWGDRAVVREYSHQVVSYFPEHTCTVSESMTVVPVSGSAPHPWTVFGKIRYDDAGADTFSNMQALWDSAGHQQGTVAYARALGYDAARRLLWQEAVAGSTLESLLDGAGPQLLERVGRAVAALHATPLASARVLRGADLIANLQRAQRTLELGLADAPELVRTCAGLAGELQRAWQNVDCSANATLHGDLHGNNILVAPAQVALIDLDRAMRGPALAELGGFLAGLICRACVQRREIDNRRLAIVIDAYRRSVPWAVDNEQLAWHTAAALVHERAYRCVTSLKPGRIQALPRLLDVAGRILRGDAVLAGRDAEAAWAVQA